MFAFNFAAAMRNYSCIIVCIRILSLENIEPKLNQSESVLQYLSHFCASDIEIASQARLFGPVFTGLIKILHSVLSIALSWQRALVNFGNRNSNMFFFHRTRLASVISSRLESLKAISI